MTPLRYQPRWRDLPALAWIAARAYAPTSPPSHVLAGFVAVCSLLLWLPTVITMRAGRHLAALDRHAMVEVAAIGDSQPVAARLRLTGAAVTALLTLLLMMITLGIFVADLSLRVGLGKHAAMTVAAGVVVVPTVIAVAAMEPWRVIRSAPPLARTIRALHSKAPATPVWRLGAMATWPHGSGHGNALHTGLLRDWPRDGHVVCYPRNRAVEEWYRRLGMQRHPADGALYLDLRSRRAMH